MPMYTFRSDDPDASALDVDHGAVGLKGEHALNHEAYWDPTHRLHQRAVSEARAAFAAIYGDKPVDGSQPFGVSTISSKDGSVLEPDLLGTPTVATGESGDADESGSTRVQGA